MITFDTGALIALERNKRRVVELFQRLVQRGDDITVPAAVVAEWWRAARPSPHAERGRGARGGGLYMME